MVEPLVERNKTVHIRHGKSLPPIQAGDEMDVQGLGKWHIKVLRVIKVDPLDEQCDSYTLRVNRTYISGASL